MAKLFVSYSRRDSVVARKLIDAFKSIQQDVWVDWESIPPAADWLEQIFHGIEESDAFIFLISPDSIASEVCKVEIGRAALNNKRIIPIVLRDVKPDTTPESIRKLNWTFIRETDSFDEGLAKVKTAIELDLDWLEEHRRLQVRALEWHRKKDISLLLRGRDLRNARHMVATATAKDPLTTELQTKFILHSQKNERNRTIAWIATAVTVVIMGILTYTAVLQSRLAIANEKLAKANEALALQNEALALQNAQIAKQNETIALANEKEAKKQKAIAEENKKIAEAERSAARAQIYQTQPGELYTSTLLAIDSWLSIPSDEAEEILRRNISLLPLPMAQFSQSGQINVIRFSPDGSTFITASADGTTCARNVVNGKDLFCGTSSGTVTDAAFSKDAKLIATGDASGVVQVLDAESGDVKYDYRRFTPAPGGGSIRILDVKNGSAPPDVKQLEFAVRGVNIFTNGSRLMLAIAYADGKIPVLELQTGKLSSPLETTGRPHIFALSPNGIWLAAGSENGVVTTWNLTTGQSPLSHLKHRGGVLALAFSPNNRIIATGGKDNAAVLSDIRTGNELLRIQNENWVRDIAFSPDGSWFVTVSDDKRIRVWDTEGGTERYRVLQDSIITDVKVSANGQWIATTGSDRTVRVWNAATGGEIFQIPLDASGTELGFSNDGKYLVSGDERGATDIWDISVMTASAASLQFNGIVDNVQYSPAGDRLAVSDENRVWLLNPEPLSELTVNPRGTPTLTFKSKVKDVVFSPDSKLLGILTEGNEVGVYNLGNRGLKKLEVSSLVRSIAFTPDSQQFITGDTDGNMKAWDALKAETLDLPTDKYTQVFSLAASPELLAIGSTDKIYILGADGDGGYPEIESLGDNVLLVLNADGSLMASGNSSGQINIWKLQNGAFSPLTSFIKDQAVSLAFTPAGDRLAIGTTNNVLLINVMTGEEIARIPHMDIVNGISFSADGTILATASSKTLQFWNIANIHQIKRDDLVTTACFRLIHNFDTGEWTTLFGNQPYRRLCENLP